MIIYQNTKQGFIDDVRDNLIADKIEEEFKNHNISHNNLSEYKAWSNSLMFMRNVLDEEKIDSECKVAIEYQIPLTSKRVDFLISGLDEENNKNVVVVELKQWEDSEICEQDYLVRTFTAHANRVVTHPSYQAYSYAKIISNFNEDVDKDNISLYPCAYLHNYKEENRSHIDNDFYKNALELAPMFLKNDTKKFREFLKKYIVKKADEDLLFKIENGKLRPSKSLQDSLSNMLKGNKEFYLIDEQKVVYETVKQTVTKIIKKINSGTSNYEKCTIIVKGGPGTGKSVVAIQLLSNLISLGYSANYVTKNSAPRNVYFKKLRQDDYKKSYISNLFKGSGSFIDCKKDTFDCLIVDEAHRLNMKSGMFQNLGENQAKEIIHASKVSIFFIDEDQIVTTKDVGSIKLIEESAMEENSAILQGDDYTLVSQFRCDGSDGYLLFLDNLLGIRETANTEFDFDYDLRLFDSPTKMREELKVLNQMNNKSRMVAGYCFEWVSKKDDELFDINLEDGFSAKWNLNNTDTWAIDQNSFNEIGCIHTCQGLEFDYVGVIIGKDLIYKDGKAETNYLARAKTDKSLQGIKKSKDYKKADRIIRNTYKVLLSRGMKGCFIYCEDKTLLEYISKITKKDIIY